MYIKKTDYRSKDFNEIVIKIAKSLDIGQSDVYNTLEFFIQMVCHHVKKNGSLIIPGVCVIESYEASPTRRILNGEEIIVSAKNKIRVRWSKQLLEEYENADISNNAS